MGLFNFIETFFFISLGITFMLILLLVYHFKQRLNTLEQKSNTMFEIINNIVSEITSIKQPRYEFTQPSHAFTQPSHAFTQPSHAFTVNKMSNIDLNNIKEYVPVFVPKSPVVNANNNIQFKISENDTDESSNDTDSEIDDLAENESDSDNNSEMDDSDEDSVDSVIDKIVVSDNDEPKIVNTEQVKIILLHSNDLELNDLELNDLELNDLELNDLELNDTELDSLDKTSDFKTIIKKEFNEIAEISEIVEISEIKEIVIKTPKELLMDTYNKMSSTELKTIIIQKGLNTDPSKMKRPRLLQLLEKSID